MPTPPNTGCSVADAGHTTPHRVRRYHVALVPKQTVDLEAELNAYTERGWVLVALDGHRAVFAEFEADEETAT